MLLRQFRGRESGFGDWQSGSTRVAAFAPDGKTLALACADNTVRLCDPQMLERNIAIAGFRHPVREIAFTPDSNRIATACGDPEHPEAKGEVRLWETTGKPATMLEGGAIAANSVAISPDGKTLAAAGIDGRVRLWKVDTGKVAGVIEAHKGVATCVAFAPDGKAMASGGVDGAATLWDRATTTAIRTLIAHQGGVTGVAFAPDGKTIATCGQPAEKSDPGEVALWDVASGNEQTRHRDLKAPVACVVFSPDGKTLSAATRGLRLAYSPDGVRLLIFGKCIDEAGGIYGWRISLNNK
jgi:WD40 repeat protein